VRSVHGAFLGKKCKSRHILKKKRQKNRHNSDNDEFRHKKRILKNVLFLVLTSIAKFGSLLLWMIANFPFHLGKLGKKKPYWTKLGETKINK
jgi:hypothetical protein